jgi:hypothetical protein
VWSLPRAARARTPRPPAKPRAFAAGPPVAVESGAMDRTLTGTLIVGAAFLPWAVEVLHQLRLQARFLAALPPLTRAALPRHPRRPWLAFLGSPRFQLALWRCFRRDLGDDPPGVLALKRRMRATLRRELAWSTIFIATLSALLVAGWRPVWP